MGTQFDPLTLGFVYDGIGRGLDVSCPVRGAERHFARVSVRDVAAEGELLLEVLEWVSLRRFPERVARELRRPQRHAALEPRVGDDFEHCPTVERIRRGNVDSKICGSLRLALTLVGDRVHLRRELWEHVRRALQWCTLQVTM